MRTIKDLKNEVAVAILDFEGDKEGNPFIPTQKVIDMLGRFKLRLEEL